MPQRPSSALGYSAESSNYELRGQWIRLETLTHIRWIAVMGQLAALFAGWGVLGLQLPIGACFAVVAASALATLSSRLLFPRSRRLNETEALLTLLFDTTQLSILLYLTGGLTNPFAILLLAPVTVAAAGLPLRSTAIIGGMSLLITTVLAVAYEPLHFPDGTQVDLPDLMMLGFWAALMIGIAFIGLYLHFVARERHTLAEALFATQLALAREQKLTDLGGVVAAAAHELGTPLATIKLVSTEMMAALKDQPDLSDDAQLIRQQAERCREILQSMGSAGKRDELVNQVPLLTLIEEAAGPHLERGREVEITAGSGNDMSKAPEVIRRSEIIHGLRNLIQNAVDFSRETVEIDAEWTEDTIRISVRDDGPGYPPQLLGRIGEPWLRPKRSPAQPSANDPEGRREYEGMGMGLFIAKTLLERTGARIAFENIEEERGQISGARATVTWSRRSIEAERHRALGENQPVGRD